MSDVITDVVASVVFVIISDGGHWSEESQLSDERTTWLQSQNNVIRIHKI